MEPGSGATSGEPPLAAAAAGARKVYAIEAVPGSQNKAREELAQLEAAHEVAQRDNPAASARPAPVLKTVVTVGASAPAPVLKTVGTQVAMQSTPAPSPVPATPAAERRTVQKDKSEAARAQAVG